MKSVISDKHYHDEQAAYDFAEARIWPDGPICPHCGGIDSISKMQGKSTRIGAYKCYQCRKPFTVKVGTIFESSHVPMRHWLQAMFLIASSKKGISANQLHRTLGCTLKTAWFIGHRIREAMKLVGIEPMGGAGKVVEVDETYMGNKDVVTKRTKKGKPSMSMKRSIVALVERSGPVRTFHVERADMNTVVKIMKDNIARESEINTDERNIYQHVSKSFDSHHTVVHTKEEYVRYEGERTVHTNTVEGVFSVFKRGMKGTYQHCGEKHLHRYLAEFDFRYNNRIALGINDLARADNLLQGVSGKRLTYRTANQRS
jgi:transposase-like protein